MEVRFHYSGVKFTFTNRKKLKAFIPKIFSLEKTAGETLNVIFCTDDFLLGINKNFLQHNYYTDIISFNLSAPESPVIGELYISVDRVKENAEMLDTTFKIEIHRVIFHGILHLCGYRDKTKKEEVLIRKMENSYLRNYLSTD